MAPIQLKYVVSFSSQDSKHPVENLLDPNSCKRWMSPASEKSGRLEAEFQLDRACLISHVDIGTYFVFSVQMLVGRSSWPSSQEFRSLLPSSTFMTPDECRSGKNKISIRMFKRDNFDQSVAAEKWDRLRIICSQPFRKDVQFGLSLLKVVADDDQDSLANGSALDLNSSFLSTRRTSSDLAAQSVSSPLASYFTSPSPDSVILKSLSKSSSRSSLTSGRDSSLSRAGQLLKAATGRVIQYKLPSMSLPMKSDEDCIPSEIASTPSPSSKGKSVATPNRANVITPACGIPSAPSNGIASTPKNCVTSATENGISATHINSVTSTPQNGVASTPKNGVASNPLNSVTPKNGIAAMPTNDITSVLKNDPRYSIFYGPKNGIIARTRNGTISVPASAISTTPKNGATSVCTNGVIAISTTRIVSAPGNVTTTAPINSTSSSNSTSAMPTNVMTSTPLNLREGRVKNNWEDALENPEWKNQKSFETLLACPTMSLKENKIGESPSASSEKLNKMSTSKKPTSAKKKNNGDCEKAIKEFLAKIDYSKLDLGAFQISDLRHQFEKTIFRKLSKDEKKFFMLTARLNVGSFMVSDDENLDDLDSSVQHSGSPSVNPSYGKKSSIKTPAILKETPAVLKTQNSRNEMVKNDSFECHNLSDCSNDDALMPFLPAFKTQNTSSKSVPTSSNSKHIAMDGNHNQLIDVGAAHKKESGIDNGASVKKKSDRNNSSLEECASLTNILKSVQNDNSKQSVIETKNAAKSNQKITVGQTVSLPRSATETMDFTMTSNQNTAKQTVSMFRSATETKNFTMTSNQNTAKQTVSLPQSATETKNFTMTSNQTIAKQTVSLPRSSTETKTSMITLNQNTVQQSASVPHGTKSKQNTPGLILPYPANNLKISATASIPNSKLPVSMPLSATETFSARPPSNLNNIRQSASLPQFTTVTKNLNPASGPASSPSPLSAKIGGNLISSTRPMSSNPGSTPSSAHPSTPASMHRIKPADAQSAANCNTAIPPNARPGWLSKPSPLPSASVHPVADRPPTQTVGQDAGRTSGIQTIHISDSDDSDSLINPTRKRKQKNKKKQSKRSRLHPPVIYNSTQSTACGESSLSVAYSTGANQFIAGPSSLGSMGNTETCPICQGKFPRETFDGHAYRCGELAMTNDVVQLSRRASFSRGLGSQASSNGQDVECPLCLRMFPSYFVEIHASECSLMTF